ncbi:hypothetical protein PN290_01475 [Romboutsia sp. 1001216sp1]|uniref:hypothetical protein n=1 Tax=unclassified Romboutsia TaxID=2626894 RepID=UPI0018AA5540|nr:MULTISPECIES: hypothetical protein [unclassified Romboutsia]MDB8794605.1 hypothetical protein [Romboutsia sp. 1001216sp1]MDB8796559.1 hypothetical protein [Romboutsia sp. 1001216sp1]MDB8798037.1 hypothetical protein [Romboutsia sp. 1001216sp1]
MHIKDEVFKEIINDLKISKYSEEDDVTYKARVVYSALALWMKISTLDGDILEDDKKGIGQSRKHLSIVGKVFLENILELYPGLKPWFYSQEANKNPQDIILERLIKSGELIKSGFNTNLAIPLYEECLVNRGVKSTRGINSRNIKIHSGLTQIELVNAEQEINNEDILQFHGLDNFTAKEILKQYVVNSQWKNRKNITCDIFNKYSKVSFYNSWENNYKLKEGEISVYRENFNDYGLIKKVNGEIYTSQFNTYLVENNEVRRFMYGLKSEVNNSVMAYYKFIDRSDCVELNLKCALPSQEENILLSLGWPKTSIADSMNLIFSIHIWDLIKLILEKLNIVVREID